MDSDKVNSDNVETTVEENHSSADSGFNSNNSSERANDSEYDTTDEDIQSLELDDKLQISDDELNNALSDEIDIIIVNDNGEKNVINSEKTSTIADIISRHIGDALNADDYDLKIDDRVLPRTISLRDAGIINGTKLRLIGRQINVFIRRVDGRTSTFDTLSTNTVESLKDQFFYTDQVPVHQQRLLFQSRELENARTLQFYGIKNNSTLEMVYRLRGGWSLI